jgi:hypothetical protein
MMVQLTNELLIQESKGTRTKVSNIIRSTRHGDRVKTKGSITAQLGKQPKEEGIGLIGGC